MEILLLQREAYWISYLKTLTPHTGGNIPVRGIISCKIKGVIDLITCSCGKRITNK
jgi:hypothetical protein